MAITLDIFKTEPFQVTTLSAAVSDLKFLPTKLRDSGLFSPAGIDTTTAWIERQGETLSLVPTAARGANGKPVTIDPRNGRDFRAVHLPQVVTVYADEVQNLRPFGKESEEDTVMNRLMQKLKVARRNNDLTLEWQRVGAIRGKILDADGSTPVLDIFNAFGFTRQELVMDLDVDTTRVNDKIMAAKRMSEDELGGIANDGWKTYCSPQFFDALTGHPAVVDAFAFYNTAGFNRSDNRKGFTLSTDAEFIEYRGKVGSTQFIEPGVAYMVPSGVPDMFLENYAPAPYNETVNTMGLPYYAKGEEMDFGKGWNFEVQSNPLILTPRPRAIIRLRMNSSIPVAS